jgi:hypothetical protein
VLHRRPSLPVEMKLEYIDDVNAAPKGDHDLDLTHLCSRASHRNIGPYTVSCEILGMLRNTPLDDRKNVRLVCVARFS